VWFNKTENEMIKLIITTLATLTLLTGLSIAPAKAELSTEQTCENIADTARQIMILRQENTAMSNVLKRNDNGAYKMIVKMAYEKPLYHGQKFKDHEVNEFKNSIFSQCLGWFA